MESHVPAYMHGQLTALAMTLDALIVHLPREMSRRVAVTLAASEDVQREVDAREGCPAAVSQPRTAIVSAWISKLQEPDRGAESDPAGTPASPS